MFCSVGLGVGLVKVLRTLAQISTGRAHLDVHVIPTNWPLLVEQCLPWVIGAKVFAMTSGSVALVPSP